MPKFHQRSLEKLKDVHPDLRRVMLEAIENAPFDFGITEGLRSKERQLELYNQGKSKTLNSRHLTGKAVDIVVFIGNEVTWDLKYYKVLSEHIKAVAKLNDVAIEWGGDWKSFVDAVHFELDRKVYK